MIEPIPWLPYQATAFINYISPDTIFEWGAGGSTIFFLQRGARVVSIEHDERWATEVGQSIGSMTIRFNNYSSFTIPYEPGDIGPDYSNPAHYKSYDTRLPPANFKNYCSFIDNYEQFDLILVDGRARASCLAHAVSHVKSGGWLVLDNSERDWYLKNTLHLFDGWERVDFLGYGPQLECQWQTTFFRNVDKSFYER